MDKYPKLFFASLEGIRCHIIIRLGYLIDKDKKSLTFKKILDMSEQIGEKRINKKVKKARKNMQRYDILIKNIKLLRDKMYAHIDYSLEKEELFDKNYPSLNKLIVNSKKLLEYIMETCVKISQEYDEDSIHLAINWIYDKQK